MVAKVTMPSLSAPAWYDASIGQLTRSVMIVLLTNLAWQEVDTYEDGIDVIDKGGAGCCALAPYIYTQRRIANEASCHMFEKDAHSTH